MDINPDGRPFVRGPPPMVAIEKAECRHLWRWTNHAFARPVNLRARGLVEMEISAGSHIDSLDDAKLSTRPLVEAHNLILHAIVAQKAIESL